VVFTRAGRAIGRIRLDLDVGFGRPTERFRHSGHGAGQSDSLQRLSLQSTGVDGLYLEQSWHRAAPSGHAAGRPQFVVADADLRLSWPVVTGAGQGIHRAHLKVVLQQSRQVIVGDRLDVTLRECGAIRLR